MIRIRIIGIHDKTTDPSMNKFLDRRPTEDERMWLGSRNLAGIIQRTAAVIGVDSYEVVDEVDIANCSSAWAPFWNCRSSKESGRPGVVQFAIQRKLSLD